MSRGSSTFISGKIVVIGAFEEKSEATMFRLSAFVALLFFAAVGRSPAGTPEEAKGMLEKAVAAVKQDKAKALDMFNNAGKASLSCPGPSPYVVSLAREPQGGDQKTQFSSGGSNVKSGNIDVLFDSISIANIHSFRTGGVAAAGSSLQRQDWTHREGLDS